MPDRPQYWVRKFQTVDPVSFNLNNGPLEPLHIPTCHLDPQAPTDASQKIQNMIEIHYLSDHLLNDVGRLLIFVFNLSTLGEATLFDSA